MFYEWRLQDMTRYVSPDLQLFWSKKPFFSAEKELFISVPEKNQLKL
jgi:hypothetical protein